MAQEMKLSKEEYDRLVEQAKIGQKAAEAEKERKMKERRYTAYYTVTMRKAKAAKLDATEKEIVDYCVEKWGGSASDWKQSKS